MALPEEPGNKQFNIYIADDNNTDRLILEFALQKLGYSVVAFSGGEEALAAIRNTNAPVVVLLDWMMPGMNGIDICKVLAANAPSNPIHTIIITSRNQKGDIAHALDSGANDFISKPFEIMELRARVNVGMRLLGAMLERENMLKKTQNMDRLESLGLLAGGIAHDFNNLMGGVFGYIDMAREETRESKVTSYLSKAMNTIERARALTGQLLTFAKGGAPIQKIGHLFPFVEETAKFALSGANVSCNFDVPQDLWACNFDKNQIGQVIDNLVINAQQAMPVGGTIELSARNVSLSEKEHAILENGNYVKISIKDTGIGIIKELLAKIFDPFFTTKSKGHGLGLATCHSIINRHGGCIDVESEPGKGSTFMVYLPASTESTSAAVGHTAKTHKGIGLFLVLDDEEVMRDIIGDMLETLGYTVVCKENGKDAIDFFIAETDANRKFAGMIFDLTIPGGMGGKEAIAEIRKFNKDIPAFVASGYADDPVMLDPAAYGFNGALVKPFMMAQLAEMLNRYQTTIRKDGKK